MAGLNTNPYYSMIQQATGVTRCDAPILERIMTEDILHCTLDWLSSEEFANAAREAHLLFKLAPPYFYSRQNLLAMTFKRMQAEKKLDHAEEKYNPQVAEKARSEVELYRHRENYLSTICQRLGATYFPFKDA